MKQVLFYFMLIMPLSLISCGDDDGNPDDFYHPYGYMEGTFPESKNGRQLTLVYNGNTLENKSVVFVSRGSAEKPQAILTFENVITGESKTQIVTDLTETVNPDKEGLVRLKFEGVYSTKSLTISYSGYIEPLVLSLNLEELKN